MSALTHAAMRNDLQRAQDKGYTVARQYLGGIQRPAVPGSGAIAWPAGGFADYGVLGNLAATGWRTVILNSSLMPPSAPVAYTPSAITSALDGVDGRLHVALTDNTLSQVLADGPTAAQARGRRVLIRPAASPAAPSRPARCRPPPRPARPRPSSVPGRDGDDRRGGARPLPVPWSSPRPASGIPPRAWPGAADRERRRALAAPGRPGQPGQRELPGRAGTAGAAAGGEVRPRRTAPVPAPQGQGPGSRYPAAGQHVPPEAVHLPGRRGGRGGIVGLAGPPAPGEGPARLGLRVPGLAGPAGPHHRYRPGHPDREVRARAGIDQQPARPAGHRAAAGAGARRAG